MVDCKIVTNNSVEASNTSFFGPNITNNSSGTLNVYCPVSLDAASNPRTLKAYGNNLAATAFALPNGVDREVDFTLPNGISNGAFRCAMGPNGSYFYNVVVNTQF